MPRSDGRVWRYLLVLLVAGAIAWLSLSPTPESRSSGFPFLRWVAGIALGDAEASDKVGHFLAYGGLVLAGLVAAPTRVLAVIGLGIAYGGAMEIAQAFVPGRSPSWADLLADAVGACAGLLTFFLLRSIVSGAPRWPSR